MSRLCGKLPPDSGSTGNRAKYNSTGPKSLGRIGYILATIPTPVSLRSGVLGWLEEWAKVMEDSLLLDLHAEASLLASLILCEDNEECWSHVAATVTLGSFALKDNAIIYGALLRMHGRNQKIDAISLRAELTRAAQWEEIGGMEFLATVISAAPSWYNWKSYLCIVIDMGQRRALVALADSMKAKAHVPNHMTALEIAADAQRRLATIIENGTESRYQSTRSLIENAYEQIGTGEVSYVPSYFDDLDMAIGGFGRSEFWVIGARPSMGKSTICRQLAVQIAKAGIPVGFISLEESLAKMGRNLLAAESGIDNFKIRSGRLEQYDWPELADGMGRLSNIPLFFTDTARRMMDIRAIAAVMQGREKIQVLFVDYLQRIRGTRSLERFEAVTELSLDLSDLAKTSGLAVVCPVQLNRALENRQEKRPTMADIRESGQIEQDADGIIFLHREDFYHQYQMDYIQDDVAELAIAKNRDGARGMTIKLKSDLRFQRFGGGPVSPKPVSQPAKADFPPPKQKDESWCPW